MDRWSKRGGRLLSPYLHRTQAAGGGGLGLLQGGHPLLGRRKHGLRGRRWGGRGRQRGLSASHKIKLMLTYVTCFQDVCKGNGRLCAMSATALLQSVGSADKHALQDLSRWQAGSASETLHGLLLPPRKSCWLRHGSIAPWRQEGAWTWEGVPTHLGISGLRLGTLALRPLLLRLALRRRQARPQPAALLLQCSHPAGRSAQQHDVPRPNALCTLPQLSREVGLCHLPNLWLGGQPQRREWLC